PWSESSPADDDTLVAARPRACGASNDGSAESHLCIRARESDRPRADHSSVAVSLLSECNWHGRSRSRNPVLPTVLQTRRRNHCSQSPPPPVGQRAVRRKRGPPADSGAVIPCVAPLRLQLSNN